MKPNFEKQQKTIFPLMTESKLWYLIIVVFRIGNNCFMYCQITVCFLSIRFLLLMRFCCCCVMLTIFFWLCSLYQMLNLSRKHSDIGFIRSISVKLLSIRRKNSFSTRFPQNLAKFKKRTLVNVTANNCCIPISHWLSPTFNDSYNKTTL